MTEEVLNLEEFYQTTDLNCATSSITWGIKSILLIKQIHQNQFS